MTGARGHRLIWSADDFGYSGPVNEGIALAHRQGRVSGASLLAGGEAFQGAVKLARELPGLDLGVHLAAVEVRSVLPPERLAGFASPEGLLPRNHISFLLAYLAGPIRPSLVESEWEAQIARVVDSGLKPIYLDSHQHLHVLPGLFEATLRLMRRFGIRAVRTPGDVVPGRPGPMRGALLSGLFALGRRARTLARRSGFATPDGTLGIGDAGNLDASRLKSYVQALAVRPPGTWELVSHPGMGEPHGSPAASWGYHWSDELEAARDESLGEALRVAGVETWSYRVLLGGP